MHTGDKSPCARLLNQIPLLNIKHLFCPQKCYNNKIHLKRTCSTFPIPDKSQEYLTLIAEQAMESRFYGLMKNMQFLVMFCRNDQLRNNTLWGYNIGWSFVKSIFIASRRVGCSISFKTSSYLEGRSQTNTGLLYMKFSLKSAVKFKSPIWTVFGKEAPCCIVVAALPEYTCTRITAVLAHSVWHCCRKLWSSLTPWIPVSMVVKLGGSLWNSHDDQKYGMEQCNTAPLRTMISLYEAKDVRFRNTGTNYCQPRAASIHLSGAASGNIWHQNPAV